MQTKTNAKLVETFWENHQRPIYIGAQSGTKIGPLMPIFSTALKVLEMSMWSNTDVKPKHLFRKWSKTGILPYFGVQNGSKIGPVGSIIYIHLKSSYNEHVKQYWCETSGNLLRKLPKSGILDLFWGPNIGPLRPILNPSMKVHVAPMSI